MHAPTYPIDQDYAAAWDEAVEVRAHARACGVTLDLADFAYNNETGAVTLDGMPAREWLDAMTNVEN